MSPADAFAFLGQLDLHGFLVMFWYTALFELPRFALGGLVAAGAELFARREPVTAPTGRVSVLLPGHNEGAAIGRTIASLREQTLGPLEIVVVDDGSTDDMAAVGRRIRAEGGINTFLSTGLRGGKSAAANLGLGYCTGGIIVIADLDTSFDRDAVARIVAPFADPRVGAVAGNLGVRNAGASIVATFQAVQYLVSISLGRRVSCMLGILFIASGAFAAFRREALLSVGGWEVGPGEDADITAKIRRAGWRIRFASEAWALTDVPDSLLALARQRLRWNRSMIRVRLRKFARLFNPMQRNFSLADALGTLDILYFQGLRPAAFFVYVAWLFMEYAGYAWVVLAVVALFYCLLETLILVLAAAVSGHHGRLALLPYAPGYALFNGIVLRAVSVWAYLDELTWRRSYRDPYVPLRVLNRVERF
jgi:poly-beta-1,6-N-acetyl-D-glucosamine synthase